MIYRCSECGKCCRTLTMTGGDEITRLRECYIGDVEYKGTKHMVFDMVCKHLDTKTNKCKIHGEHPNRCKEFPKGEEEFWKIINPKCTMC